MVASSNETARKIILAVDHGCDLTTGVPTFRSTSVPSVLRGSPQCRDREPCSYEGGACQYRMQ